MTHAPEIDSIFPAPASGTRVMQIWDWIRLVPENRRRKNGVDLWRVCHGYNAIAISSLRTCAMLPVLDRLCLRLHYTCLCIDII